MQDKDCPLTVDDLELWRGGRCLFTQLTFALASGQAAVISGTNGSGKTTLLRVLTGLAVPEHGRVCWRRQPIGNLQPQQRSELHYQGHLDGLKRELTVMENLDLFRRLWGSCAEPGPALEALGLNALADRPVRTLSAGQRRRAALTQLKLSAAKLWILDEPFTNLDPQGRQLVEQWLREHLGSGGLAIVASHQELKLDGASQLRVEL